MNPWMHAIGWTLIHFVWQGAVLAVVTAGALRLCRPASANARYVIASAALLAMLASAVITAGLLAAPDPLVAPLESPAQTVRPTGEFAIGTGNWLGDRGLSMNAVRTGVDALLPAIVSVWLAGVGLFMVRMAGGLWRVRRLHAGSLAMARSRWQQAAERLASRLGLPVSIHVVDSTSVDGPVALGWLRPVILLPVAALATLTPSQVEAILAHELIHIRRHDYLVNLAQTFAEAVLFFHPAVWWVSAHIRSEREHCCDDAVLRLCGDPVDYATALTELEAWRTHQNGLALAATGGALTRRVRRMLNMPIGREARSLSGVMTAGVTCVLFVMIGGMHLSSMGAGSEGAGLEAGGGQAIGPITAPDTFDWQVHRTAHFDIYYYPALTLNLTQAANSAERAYQRVSSELQYHLPLSVPLILFKTRDDFAQQGIAPEARAAIARGDVAAFSEPERNRIVMLVDDDVDRLDRLITHELTHIFAFDIIPRPMPAGSRVPTWIDEGLADYMTGSWDPANLRQIRDLVNADRVPTMTALGESTSGQRRAAVDFGHAAFEFIESEYGSAAIWQFLLAVRRNVVDGDANVYRAAFNRTSEEFDSAFARYLRDRFGQ